MTSDNEVDLLVSREQRFHKWLVALTKTKDTPCGTPATSSTHRPDYQDVNTWKHTHFTWTTTVQVSLLTNWLLGGGHEGYPLSVFSAGGPCEQFWHGRGMSTLCRCSSSISSADHGVAHPPRCPEGWFWRGCHGVGHARTMQASVDSSIRQRPH